MLTRKASFLGLTSIFLAGLALGGEAIPNWPAPATWSPPRAHGVTTLSETNPLPFTAVTPCRIVDTRGNGAPIQGGIFTGGSDVRNYVLAGICGIPAAAAAVSLNFTVTGPGQTAPGFLTAWPTGGTVPPVSILNWDHVPAQIANAGVVPTGETGFVHNAAITVNVSASTHVIIDVNGYYFDFTYGAAQSLAPGRLFGIAGNAPGGVIQGYNSSSADYSFGVEAFAEASTGLVFGVGGYNLVSPTNGAAGVYGLSQAGGNTYGVYGTSYGTSGAAAGVAGVDHSGAPVTASGTSQPSGVLGLSQSHPGVEGDSYSVGVRGRSFNTAGTLLAVGLLAFHQGGITPHDYGVWSTGDYGGTGAKYFVEPHATDPSKVIRYVALEGNESGTYFRGTANTVEGEAVIDVPEDFRMVTDSEGLTVQLTPVGRSASMFVVSEDLNQIVVRSNRDVKFHYQVNGVRRAFKNFVPVGEGQEFVPNSVAAPGLAGYPEEIQKRLIANGTYNADGTINMETARRLGWTKIWEEQTKAATAKPKIE